MYTHIFNVTRQQTGRVISNNYIEWQRAEIMYFFSIQLLIFVEI